MSFLNDPGKEKIEIDTSSLTSWISGILANIVHWILMGYFVHLGWSLWK